MDLTTKRLVLSRPRLADAPALFRVLGNPEAMRYTLIHASLSDLRRYLAGHECQRRRFGYGPWVVRSRGDGTIIGFGGIYQDPFDPGWGAEVGYYFASETWGQGLASELTQACVGAANDVFSLEELRAFAHPENAASRRVLVKAGFREQRFVPEMNRLLFVLALPGKAV